MRTLTGMCCLHMEFSIPGHPFQSLSGFLACYDRRPGVSHIHQQSFDPSNLIIFVPVNKNKRKTATRLKKNPFKLQMIVTKSRGRKTQVHSVIRYDDGEAITHRFNSDFSLENPLQNNDLCEQNNLSLSCSAGFLSGCSQQHNWKLFRGFGQTGWSNLPSYNSNSPIKHLGTLLRNTAGYSLSHCP